MVHRILISAVVAGTIILAIGVIWVGLNSRRWDGK
jgi:hypothetical protein